MLAAYEPASELARTAGPNPSLGCACDTSDDHVRQVVEAPSLPVTGFPDRNTRPHGAPIAPTMGAHFAHYDAAERSALASTTPK
jgi:hypothetical protein